MRDKVIHFNDWMDKKKQIEKKTPSNSIVIFPFDYNYNIEQKPEPSAKSKR